MKFYQYIKKNRFIISAVISGLLSAICIFFLLNISRPLRESVNLLLLSSDNKDRYGNERFDSITLFHFPSDTEKTVAMLSVPRDTCIIPIKGYCPPNKKINIHTSISDMKSYLEKTFSIKINRTAKIGTPEVEKFFDLLGGLEIYVDKDMKYDDYTSNLHIDLKKGRQILNGKQIHHFLRFRTYNKKDKRFLKESDDDIIRISRKKQVLNSFLTTLAKKPQKIPLLISYLKNTDTNLTFNEIFILGTNLFYSKENNMFRTDILTDNSKNLNIFEKPGKLRRDVETLIDAYFSDKWLLTDKENRYKQKYRISIFNTTENKGAEIDLAMKLMADKWVISRTEQVPFIKLPRQKNTIITGNTEPYYLKSLQSVIGKNNTVIDNTLPKSSQADITIFLGDYRK